jgi:hypothetical protein
MFTTGRCGPKRVWGALLPDRSIFHKSVISVIVEKPHVCGDSHLK